MTNRQSKSIRIFKNEFLEAIFKCYTIPHFAIRGALIGYLLRQAIAVDGLPLATLLGFGLFGIGYWTLNEYLFHRFIYHLPVKGQFAKRWRYVFHGHHHANPNDDTRYLAPTIPAAIVTLIGYFMFRALLGSYANPFFAGLEAAFITYECCHVILHTRSFDNAFIKGLRKNHMRHHYSTDEVNFGVVTPFWDHAFTTFERREMSRKPYGRPAISLAPEESA